MPDGLMATFTNAKTLVAFVMFIVPGFVSLRTYETFRGGERQKISDAVIDVVVYSFVTDVVALPLLPLTLQIPNVAIRSLAFAVAAALLLVGLPVCIGWQWYKMQQRFIGSGNIAHPTLKPWDEVFTQIGRQKKQVGLILTLHDGRKIGGKYVDPGFASEYPADEQLFLGESWSVNQCTGRFEQSVSGSYGLLIDKKDILTVEFVEWAVVEEYLLNTSGSEHSERSKTEPRLCGEGASGAESDGDAGTAS